MTKKTPFRILIADEDPEYCFLFEMAIKELNENARVDFVQNGEQLIDYFKSDKLKQVTKGHIKPDMIITKLDLPVVNGIDAMRKFKANDQTAGIPVYIYSDTADVSVREAAIAEGVFKYFLKPATFHNLKIILKSILVNLVKDK